MSGASPLIILMLTKNAKIYMYKKNEILEPKTFLQLSPLILPPPLI